LRTETYLDYSATTPIETNAVKATRPCPTSFDHFAYAKFSQQNYGQNAALALENAHSELACGDNVILKDIIFTSCNNIGQTRQHICKAVIHLRQLAAN